MTIKPNEFAFPFESEGIGVGSGLTKREYFAAIAMQGLLAGGWQRKHEQMAEASVEIADALIERLNKN